MRQHARKAGCAGLAQIAKSPDGVLSRLHRRGFAATGDGRRATVEVCVPPAGVNTILGQSSGHSPAPTPATAVSPSSKKTGNRCRINDGLADPKLKARFADLGATVFPGSPADFGKLTRTPFGSWRLRTSRESR
jgi:hypothetical protein